MNYLSCKNVINFVRKLKTSAFQPCKLDFCNLVISGDIFPQNFHARADGKIFYCGMMIWQNLQKLGKPFMIHSRLVELAKLPLAHCFSGKTEAMRVKVVLEKMVLLLYWVFMVTLTILVIWQGTVDYFATFF